VPAMMVEKVDVMLAYFNANFKHLFVSFVMADDNGKVNDEVYFVHF
jgi:hypothetical protein